MLKADKALRSWTEKMIKAQKLRGQALIDAWNEIATLNGQIADLSNKTTQHVTQTSSRLLTAGLDLSGAQRKALEARYSDAMAHGGHLSEGMGANGIYINGDLNLTGVNDVKGLADKLTKHAKRNSGQTRGTRGGSYLGHH